MQCGEPDSGIQRKNGSRFFLTEINAIANSTWLLQRFVKALYVIPSMLTRKEPECRMVRKLEGQEQSF
jgi:hypothetical protein